MRIVFFEFAIHLGGARRSTIELASRLSAHADVTVVDAYGCCKEFASAVQEAGLRYRVAVPQDAKIVGGFKQGIVCRASKILQAMPGLLKVQKRLRDILNDIKADVVCSNCLKGAVVISTIPRVRVRSVAYMRGWYTPDTIPPYARYTLRRRVSRIFAVSYATRAALVCGGIPCDKIDVIPNAVDIASLGRRADFPTSYDTLPAFAKRPRILVAADYVRRKGQLSAIRAVAELVKRGHDPVLYLAGDVGWAGDPQYSNAMRALAEELGITDNVHQIGVVENIPALIRSVDIVALPSHTEGMPRVLLEGMAMGKPIIATPVGGVLDLILPGITGLLHEVDDYHGLAACIEECVRRPDFASIMGERAHCFVRERFNPVEQTKAIMSALHSLVLSKRYC